MDNDSPSDLPKLIKKVDTYTGRREFLKFLAGSPLLAAFGLSPQLLGQSASQVEIGNDLITVVGDALNVFDFETVAKDKLPPAHWGYLASGVEDDATLRANRDAFKNYHLRPRRLVDVSTIDMKRTLFGVEWDSPIFLCPVASQKAFHAEGEIAVAKAAKEKNHLQILSTVTTSSVEDVIAARGTPVWYQLYTYGWEITQSLVNRAEKAGCPVLVLTVDQLLPSRNSETRFRFIRKDTRDCLQCHIPDYPLRNKRMFDGVNLETRLADRATLTWDIIHKLREVTGMKIVVKGIVTREDAKLCLKHDVDGIIVSNHGGRGQESGWASLDGLPEVVQVVDGKLPVMIDSGFRRGTDIYKALALGATAVGIGRPYMWGLAAFGQEGVERVLEILRLELELAMMSTGARTLEEISRTSIGKF
ncbi:MAG: alpha-hydroxy acid oxidase [Candidatus Poribacteria bacterium]|nr:alpha-hydroxy acid oxidase [Candidatus Poribacteria bacterium]